MSGGELKLESNDLLFGLGVACQVLNKEPHTYGCAQKIVQYWVSMYAQKHPPMQVNTGVVLVALHMLGIVQIRPAEEDGGSGIGKNYKRMG